MMSRFTVVCALIAIGFTPSHSLAQHRVPAAVTAPTVSRSALPSPPRERPVSVSDSSRASLKPFLVSGLIVGGLLGAATYRFARQDDQYFARPLVGLVYINIGGLLGAFAGLIIYELAHPSRQRGLTR